MKFKVLIQKGDIRTTTEMSAVEIADKYDCHIRLCDLQKKQAPIVVYKKEGLTVKVYGYEG